MKIVLSASKRLPPHPTPVYDPRLRFMQGALITTANVPTGAGNLFSIADLQGICANFTPCFGPFGTSSFSADVSFPADDAACYTSKLYMHNSELRADIFILETLDGELLHELLQDRNSRISFYKAGTMGPPKMNGFVQNYTLVTIYAA